MARKHEPAVELATLRDDMIDQANDYKILERAGRKYAEKMRELNPETYAPEFLERRTLEIQQEASGTVGPVLARLRERHERAQQAKDLWRFERRRLDASLADPVTAAALSSRIALVAAEELPRLAREAADRPDWLLADAVLNRVNQLEPNANGMAIGQQVQQAIQGIDGEHTRLALEAIGAIGQDFARAQIVRAEISGKPLTTIQKLALAYEHPGLQAPVGL
jgi:hypothetical protein